MFRDFRRGLVVLLVLVITLGCIIGCTPKDETAGDETTKKEYVYPSKGVLTSVIAYSAGGTSDNIVRKISIIMAEHLKCNSNAINVTGGSASVAGLKVQDEGKDGAMALGYLLPASGSWKTLGYTKDIEWNDWYSFAAVQSPFCFSVSKNSDFKTLQDVLDYAKSNPGKMKWGTAGIGSAIHLSGLMVLDSVGVSAIAVPFSGGREAATNVMAGEVDWVWASMGDVKDLLESGDLICLGSASKNVMSIESPKGNYDVPSLFNIYPDAAASAAALGVYGMALPRTAPPEAVAAFAEAFDYAVNTQDFKDFASSLGMLPVCIYGEEIDKMMAQAQSLYAWTLYDQGLAADKITPEALGIPKPADFDFSKVDLAGVQSWPVGR